MPFLFLTFAANAAAQSESKIVNFESDVLPIFKARCAECHVGETAKNEFQIFDRDALLGYVDSGGSLDSSLWIDYLIANPKSVELDSLVMPPTGPLPANELAVLKLWLDEGAIWPDNLATPDLVRGLGSVAKKVLVAEAPVSSIERSLTAAGFFHPAVVHFPIAIILLGAAAAFFSYIGGGDFARRLALLCLIIGALSSIVSCIAGWGFAIHKGYTYVGLFPPAGWSEDQLLLHRHRWFGIGSAVFSLVLAMVATVSFWKSKSGHFWRIGLIGCAMLVSITGHQGGELVYGDILHKAWEKMGWEESTPSIDTSKPEGDLP